MEGVFAAVAFIEAHPAVMAFLQVVSIVMIWALWRSSRQGRAKVYDQLRCIDKRMDNHERSTEGRLSRVEATLEILLKQDKN